jgi:hypothetical protein
VAGKRLKDETKQKIDDILARGVPVEVTNEWKRGQGNDDDITFESLDFWPMLEGLTEEHLSSSQDQVNRIRTEFIKLNVGSRGTVVKTQTKDEIEVEITNDSSGSRFR